MFFFFETKDRKIVIFFKLEHFYEWFEGKNSDNLGILFRAQEHRIDKFLYAIAVKFDVVVALLM